MFYRPIKPRSTCCLHGLLFTRPLTGFLAAPSKPPDNFISMSLGGSSPLGCPAGRSSLQGAANVVATWGGHLRGRSKPFLPFGPASLLLGRKGIQRDKRLVTGLRNVLVCLSFTAESCQASPKVTRHLPGLGDEQP